MPGKSKSQPVKLPGEYLLIDVIATAIRRQCDAITDPKRRLAEKRNLVEAAKVDGIKAVPVQSVVRKATGIPSDPTVTVKVTKVKITRDHDAFKARRKAENKALAAEIARQPKAPRACATTDACFQGGSATDYEMVARSVTKREATRLSALCTDRRRWVDGQFPSRVDNEHYVVSILAGSEDEGTAQTLLVACRGFHRDRYGMGFEAEWVIVLSDDHLDQDGPHHAFLWASQWRERLATDAESVGGFRPDRDTNRSLPVDLTRDERARKAGRAYRSADLRYEVNAQRRSQAYREWLATSEQWYAKHRLPKTHEVWIYDAKGNLVRVQSTRPVRHEPEWHSDEPTPDEVAWTEEQEMAALMDAERPEPEWFDVEDGFTIS